MQIVFSPKLLEEIMLRIRKEISDKFKTQRSMSEAIELHETTISNIIGGILRPNDSQKEKFEKALGLSWEELMKEI
jgi:ribosome-binding protein aMBF1 (putative translation factor)